MKLILWWKSFLEWLGGAQESPPWHKEVEPGKRSRFYWLWGVWWSILIIGISVFCGQSSKFIYIDF